MIKDNIQISLPENINNKGVCAYLRDFSWKDRALSYTLNCGKIEQVHPFATLVLGIVLRQFIEENIHEFGDDFGGIRVNYQEEKDAKNLMRILHETGFLDILHGKELRSIDDLKIADNHIPIVYIDKQNVINKARCIHKQIGDVLQVCANEVADLVAKVFPTDIDEYFQCQIYAFLSFCIREMLRNAIEHGECGGVYLSGNCYPTTNRVEIAIVDRGIGVHNSIKQLYPLTPPEDIIELALLPGVSGKVIPGKETMEGSEWSNSGYGLYLTSKLCSINNESSFSLVSNGFGKTVQHGRLYNYNLNIRGTAACLNVRFEEHEYYENLFQQILSEGEAIASRKGYITKASSSSRNFFQRRR